MKCPGFLRWLILKTKIPENETYIDAGKRLYAKNCMSCHGTDRQGSGNFPSLIGLPKKYSEKAFHELVVAGRRRMMPAFKQLPEEERKAIAAYFLDLKKEQQKKYIASDKQTRFISHYALFNYRV